MKNQVFVCGTLFHIYISILKVFELKKKCECETLLIVNDHTPGIDDLIVILKEKKYFTYVNFVPFFGITEKLNKKENFIQRTIYRNELSVMYVEDNSTINNYNEFIINAEINLFYNLGLVSTFFLIKYKKNYFRMLEDGYRNYHPRVNALKAFKRKYILRTVIGEGRDNLIKSIEVQFPEKLPDVVREKGILLNLTKMQKNLSNLQKKELISVFLKDESIKIQDSKNLLLITQPLSEDRVLSEETKVDMYNTLLKEYVKGYNIYIKTHPREVTNYLDKLDVNFTEIPRSFPLEFLDFMDNINFDIGITVFSSALDNINCVNKKVFLGKSYIAKKALRKY